MTSNGADRGGVSKISHDIKKLPLPYGLDDYNNSDDEDSDYVFEEDKDTNDSDECQFEEIDSSVIQLCSDDRSNDSNQRTIRKEIRKYSFQIHEAEYKKRVYEYYQNLDIFHKARTNAPISIPLLIYDDQGLLAEQNLRVYSYDTIAHAFQQVPGFNKLPGVLGIKMVPANYDNRQMDKELFSFDWTRTTSTNINSFVAGGKIAIYTHIFMLGD